MVPEDMYRHLVARLPEKMQLVHTQRGDRLTDSQVEELLKGDYPDSLSEWEWDTTNEAVRLMAEELLEEFDPEDVADFKASDWHEHLLEVLRDMESGEWFNELLRNTPSPIFRVPAGDFEEWAVESLAEHLGIALVFNSGALTAILRESYPPYSPSWVFTLDDLKGIFQAKKITVKDPHLWLGNPYSGNGWMERIVGEVTIENLTTDSRAFGYGAGEVFGISSLPESSWVDATPEDGVR